MTHFLPRLALVSLALASASQADYVFLFPTTAVDSAAVNAAIPMRTVDEGKGTTTTLTASAGAVKIAATWGAVPNWGAAAGIQLPINNQWAPVDFSGVTAVTFSYKTGDAKTAIEFAPISDLYPGYRCANGVMMLAPYAGSTTFKKVTVGLPDGIAFADWMFNQHPSETTVTWDDVKSSIQALQFSPKPVYNSTGSAISGAATSTLEIKDVSIQGENNIGGGNVSWATQQGRGCVGKANRLSNFGGPNPARNVQGGSWFAYTDSTSGTPGFANGVSKLLGDERTVQGITYIPGDVANPAMAGITANLDKGDAMLHPYAGWAGMGTRFKRTGSDSDTALDLSGLKAISFRLEMDSAFDETNLRGVQIRVVNRSVGDSVHYNIGIPFILNHQEICIEGRDFTQPHWYTSKNGGAKPLPLKDIEGFLWEMKINADKTTKASTSSFFIGDVKFWSDSGLANLGEPAVKDSLTPDVIPPRVRPVLPPSGTCTDGISRRMAGSRSSLVANYTNVLVLSYALDGAASVKVEVLRMDGRKVASFEATGSAKNQAFPVTLGQGTYLAVVKGAKASLVAPFVVAR
jgi:hypothetical protein